MPAEAMGGASRSNEDGAVTNLGLYTLYPDSAEPASICNVAYYDALVKGLFRAKNR